MGPNLGCLIATRTTNFHPMMDLVISPLFEGREAWGVCPCVQTHVYPPIVSDIPMVRNWWFNPIHWIWIANVADIASLVCEPLMGCKPSVSAGPGHSRQRPGKSPSLGQQWVDHALSTLAVPGGPQQMASILRMPTSVAADSCALHVLNHSMNDNLCHTVDETECFWRL